MRPRFCSSCFQRRLQATKPPRQPKALLQGGEGAGQGALRGSGSTGKHPGGVCQACAHRCCLGPGPASHSPPSAPPERANVKVDVGGHPKHLGRAAAALPAHQRRVRLVHNLQIAARQAWQGQRQGALGGGSGTDCLALPDRQTGRGCSMLSRCSVSVRVAFVPACGALPPRLLTSRKPYLRRRAARPGRSAKSPSMEKRESVMTTARAPAWQRGGQRGRGTCRHATGWGAAFGGPAATVGWRQTLSPSRAARRGGDRELRPPGRRLAQQLEQPAPPAGSRRCADSAPAAALTLRDLAPQQLLQVSQVVVAVDQQAGAVAPPQARPIHDAGVVELVRQDHDMWLCLLGGLLLLLLLLLPLMVVLLLLGRAQAWMLAKSRLLRAGLTTAATAAAAALGPCLADDRGHGQVGSKAGGEQQAVLGALQLCQRRLQPGVPHGVAAHKRRGAGACGAGCRGSGLAGQGHASDGPAAA